MLKIKLYGNREEGAALAEQIGKIARIRKCAKFFPDHSGAEIGDTYLEAEIDVAEKEAAERERAEKLREKVLDFIAEIKKARIPITFIADEEERRIGYEISIYDKLRLLPNYVQHLQRVFNL